MMEYSGRRIRIIANNQEAARVFRHTPPSEWWRFVVAVTGIFVRIVACLSKGAAVSRNGISTPHGTKRSAICCISCIAYTARHYLPPFY